MEAEAIEKVRDMEIETKTMLEEQRSDIINQTSNERNLQECKAAIIVQSLEQQLRLQSMSYLVEVMTAKLREMTSSISMQTEIVNMLIKKLSSVCPKKWKN